MRGKSRKFVFLLAALLTVLAVAAAGCGGDEEGGGGGGAGTGEEGGGGEGGALVFGTAADPVVLDGALVSDGESIRVIGQIFETLVFLEPGGTEPVPGLATEWESDEAGTSWTFTLRDGVTFHDGTPFNAEATTGRSSSAGSRRPTRTPALPRRACTRAARCRTTRMRSST